MQLARQDCPTNSLRRRQTGLSPGFPADFRPKSYLERPVFLSPGRAKLPSIRNLRAFYLAYLSQPRADRLIYQAIRRVKARRIMEIGIGIGHRAVRLIEVAGGQASPDDVEFIGVDPFEARRAAEGPGVTLKMAHRLLSRSGARVKLIPGRPDDALARSANALGTLDLIVISCGLNPESLRQAWYYMPRLLHPGTQIFVENALPGGRTSVQLVASHQLKHLAAASRVRRAA